MNKIITLFLLVASANLVSANPLSQHEKDYTTIKIWGFLKYYHPEVAQGKFDWDKQLFDILGKTKTAESRESLSNVYSDWIAQLAKVPVCKSCRKPSKHEYFDKNFDLSWTQNKDLFTPELSAKLKYIEENRHRGKSHYVDTERHVGNIKILNENDYKGHDWQDVNMRLLSLARYWNQVEYFSPYKYMTDQNWDDVLTEMIPKFTEVQSDEQYRLAMLELVVKMDDSHANLVTIRTNDYFGLQWAPVGYKIIDDKAIVNEIYNDSLARANDLQIGDVIENVNGVPVGEILKRQWKYINGSNTATKLRNAYYCILNGKTDNVAITVDRNGVVSEKTIGRYSRKTFKKLVPPSKPVWEILPGNIGYVDMGRLEFDVKAVDAMMDALKKTDAIIFDIRNYPQGTMYLVGRHLNRKETPFVYFTQPDLDYPGKFVWRKDFNTGPTPKKDLYRGKIVMLVDESTQSHAEFNTMLFQTVANSTTIGSQTAGADGNVSMVVLPGNHKSYLTGLGVFYPDGTETQRKGIRVDIEVKPTIAGIRAHRDEVLEKALDFLKKGS